MAEKIVGIARKDLTAEALTDENYATHLQQFTTELLKYVMQHGIARGFNVVDIAGVMSGLTSVVVRDSGIMGTPFDPEKVARVQQMLLQWNELITSSYSIRESATDDAKRGMI